MMADVERPLCPRPTSSSSPGSPAPASRRPCTSSRTRATSASTTCRGDDPLARRALPARGLQGRARVRRLRPARRRVLRGPRRVLDELDAGRPRHRVLFLERRRADAADPLQGDPPPPPAGARRGAWRRHAARAGAARPDPRARRHIIDTTGSAPPAAPQGRRRDARARGGRASSRSPSPPSATSTARRATRPRARRPLPAEPPLRARPAAAHRLRPHGRGLRRPRRRRLEEFYARMLPLLEYLLPQYVRRGQVATSSSPSAAPAAGTAASRSRRRSAPTSPSTSATSSRSSTATSSARRRAG